MKFFGTVRQKIFYGKSWYSPPSLIQTFSIPEIIATVKDSPTEIFGTVGQKIFDGKSWYSPPSLIQTFSVPKIIATVKDSPTEIFGTVRQKIFDGKSWCPPPSYPNFFDARSYCNSKGFPYGNIRHCETKNFRRKILILPPSLIQTFSVPKIIATVKDSPTEIFGTVRQKIFDGKSWYSPPPLLFKFFRYPKLMKH